MSIEHNLNMDVRLTKRLPDNIRLWLKAMEGVTCSEDYEHVLLTTPPTIRCTAGRMERLNTNYRHDGNFYKYKEFNNFFRLRLSITNKNKDNDIERFIHFILSYVIDWETSNSIILLTTDVEQKTWLVDISETLKMNDVTDVAKVFLDSSLQTYDSDVDYESVEFMDNVKRHLKKIDRSLDYV